MNITELLKEDHREVESLIAQLEGGADHETFGKLRNSITMHTQIEEGILYPALEDFDETGELIGVEGRQRGYSKQRDQYVMAELTLSFNLTSYRCPTAK